MFNSIFTLSILIKVASLQIFLEESQSTLENTINNFLIYNSFFKFLKIFFKFYKTFNFKKNTF